MNVRRHVHVHCPPLSPPTTDIEGATRWTFWLSPSLMQLAFRDTIAKVCYNAPKTMFALRVLVSVVSDCLKLFELVYPQRINTLSVRFPLGADSPILGSAKA